MSIKQIGIEIEGAFNRYDANDTTFHHDGSVELDDDGRCECCMEECDCHDQDREHDCECDSNYNYVGELVSTPLEFDKVHEWINRNYPEEFNNSCGMHIHLSFKNDMEYSKFCSEEFYNYFLTKITDWAHKNKVKEDSRFFKRLNGQNTFCKRKWEESNAKSQLSDIGDRYNMLNYCYSKHRTIEVRLSHVWQNRDYAFRYVECVYDIFNSWLLKQKRSVRRSLKIEVLV